MKTPLKPKISIIMCFLNVESHIEEAIQSVINQQYENWELILVDDGSIDKSTEIAKHYSSHYPGKIIYLDHEGHVNKGSSESRNAGIKVAKGELLAFLDADDVLLPAMLIALLQLKQQHAATLILEASEYWYDWNDPSKANEIVQVGAQQNRLYHPPQLMMHLYPLGSGAAPCICGMLVDKKTVEKHGGFDESFWGMYDDQSFLVKLYLHESVYISDGCHNKYRQRPGSLVHSSHGLRNYHKERKRFLQWLRTYMKEQQKNYTQVNKLLQEAFLPYNPIKFFFFRKLVRKAKKVARYISNKIKMTGSMNRPLVSVLMPVFNAEKYLAEAIESILAQTFTQFEFIIIDDCSTDTSSGLIKSYRDERIRYFRNERNSGITASLNRGIVSAEADLIARMDADDVSYPERLQKQFSYMQQHPDCALLSTRANVVTSNRELIYTDSTDSGHYYFKLTFNSPFFHSSVMYRKEAVKNAGMYTVRYAEDFELFWQLSQTNKFFNLPEVLLDYRVTDESLFHVSRRSEYEEAVMRQSLRNIRSYTGQDYSISEKYLKCFQFEYAALLNENIQSILACFKELDFITESIIGTENVNREVVNIRAASQEKKLGIIEYLTTKLPYRKRILLLLRLGMFRQLSKLFFKGVQQLLKRKFSLPSHQL